MVHRLPLILSLIFLTHNRYKLIYLCLSPPYCRKIIAQTLSFTAVIILCVSPTYTVLLLKILVKHKMFINPPLKTVYYWLSNV